MEFTKSKTIEEKLDEYELSTEELKAIYGDFAGKPHWNDIKGKLRSIEEVSESAFQSGSVIKSSSGTNSKQMSKRSSFVGQRSKLRMHSIEISKKISQKSTNPGKIKELDKTPKDSIKSSKKAPSYSSKTTNQKQNIPVSIEALKELKIKEVAQKPPIIYKQGDFGSISGVVGDSFKNLE